MPTALAALTGAAILTDTTAPSLGVHNRYDATAGDLNVALPALSGLNVGARMSVQKHLSDVSGNLVAFACAGADLFDDDTTTLELGNAGDQYELQVVSVGGTKYWKVLGNRGGGAATLAPRSVKTAGYSASPRDLVPCNATGGGFTITLPEAPPDTTLVAVKKIDSSGNVVTVQRSGSDVFNTAGGPSTLQLTVQDQGVMLQYNAASAIWYVTGYGLPLTALDARYKTARILDLTYAAEPAIDTDLYDQVQLDGLTGNITSMTTNLSGSPADGQKLDIWFSDNGTIRTITWGDSFGGRLMTTTYRDNQLHLQRLIYSATAALWLGYHISQEPFLPVRTGGAVMSAATPSINTDITDQYLIYAQAEAITSFTTNLTGTPVDGQELVIRITDDGTARAITWGAKFTGILLSTTAGGGKTHLQRLRYDSVAAKWAGWLADTTGY